MPHKGMKKQVFGIVLLVLCVITALLARVIGFELDISYIAIGVIGIFFFLYGSIQKKTSHDV